VNFLKYLGAGWSCSQETLDFGVISIWIFCIFCIFAIGRIVLLYLYHQVVWLLFNFSDEPYTVGPNCWSAFWLYGL